MNAWAPTCHTLLSSLTGHIENLASCLRDFMELGCQDECVSFRFSRIVSLTAAAELYNALAEHPSCSRSERSYFETECCDAVKEVVTMTEMLNMNDFSVLDPLLGVSFSLARFQLNSCNNGSPFTRYVGCG